MKSWQWVLIAVVGAVLLVAANVVRERVFGPYVDPDDPQSGPTAIALLTQYRDEPSRAARAFDGRRVLIATALVERVDGHTVILSGGATSPGRIVASFGLTSSVDVEAGQLVSLVCTVEGASARRDVLVSGCRVSR